MLNSNCKYVDSINNQVYTQIIQSKPSQNSINVSSQLINVSHNIRSKSLDRF